MPDYEVSMDMINSNLEGITFEDDEPDQFTPVPEGWYCAQIKDFVVKEGKKSGKPYISWEMVLFADSDGTQDGFKFRGRRVWPMTSLSPNALFSFKALVRATGYTWKPGVDVGSQLAELLGSCLTVKVEIEEYNNEPQNRVTRYSTYEGDVPDISSFAGNGSGDEDIPF